MSGFTSLGKKGSGSGNGVNSNSTGPFGTALVSNMTPTAQGSFVYGNIPNNTQWVTSSIGAGAQITVDEGIMSCSSGTSLSGSSDVKLNRAIRYRAGQGVLCRLTAMFDHGAQDTLQLAGVGNEESGYYFCKNGQNFGILHRESSKREIRSMTVTAQNSVTVTVTLGNESKTFAISGGLNAYQTAHQISVQDYKQIGSGWVAEVHGNTIYFTSKMPGPITGTFDINVGAVSILSASSRVQAGVLPTDTFISQSLWNIDTMDGNGSSRMSLDVSKGNIYGVGYQYLGFGDPVFSIENSESGLLVDVHRIQTANSRNKLVLRNPTSTARWVAINSGSLASNVTIKGASAAMFNEGLITRSIGPAFASSATKSSISTTMVPVMSVRANKNHKNQCCYGELDLFQISLGCDAGSSSSNKILKIFIYRNLSLGGPVNFQSVDDRSMASVDTSATSVVVNSDSQLIKTILVAANDSMTVKIENENFFVASGDVVTIAAQRGGSSDVDAALVSIAWFEDQ